MSYPASADPTLATNVAPAQDATLTLGVDPGFPIFSQDRTYSFAAMVTPTDHRSRHGRRGDRHGRPEDGRHLGSHRHEPGRGYAAAPDVVDHGRRA